MLSKIILEAKNLPKIPAPSSLAYHNQRDALTDYVNANMTKKNDIDRLIGSNQLEMMYDNHRNHVNFMDNVFFLNNFELLARIIPWVYRAYSGHGFSFDYFPIVLGAWQEAISTLIDPALQPPLKQIYSWMIQNHTVMISVAGDVSSNFSIQDVAKSAAAVSKIFLDSLISGDHKQCIAIANDFIMKTGDISMLYLGLLSPLMQKIGKMWEEGAITVAQEHIASSIVTRIMASVYADAVPFPRTMGKAVITSAPNEFHELGAWMISDLLEQHGWNVRYLGANTPKHELIDLIRAFKPDLLAISVIMPFNLKNAADTIAEIRKIHDLEHTKIMVGGPRFNEIPDLYVQIGADGFARDAQEACLLADSWYGKKA
jgi:MerR family transcriptional regulator, light-induced transcriptional regulator